MEKVMKRIWTMAMLTFISITASADVTVSLNESYTGGTVVVKGQESPAEDGSVVVTITVTPAAGYYIRKSDIKVVATINPSGTRDGIPEVGAELTLSGDEPTYLTDARDYTFTVPEGLGAWVKEANFHSAANIGAEGADVTWSYSDDAKDVKTLTITGKGATCDFNSEGFVDPWAAIRTSIEKVVIEKEVTGLGAEIFKGCTNLTTIEINNGETVLTLGADAIPANEGLTIDVPGNLYNAYKSTDAWKDFTYADNDIKMAGVTFGDKNKYDTFVCDQDVMVPSVLCAYVISNLTEKGLELTKVTTIPKNTPVLLFSETLKDTDFRTAATDADAINTKNLLDFAGPDGKEVKLGEVYMLYNDVFYYTQAGKIPAGGVFLKTPEDVQTKTRSSYPLGDADGTTGIGNLLSPEVRAGSAWYTLDGRQLPTMPTRKGIYIKDGKKVVIK